MRTFFVLLALAAAAVLSACDGSSASGSIVFDTDQEAYAAGAAVTLSITNNSESDVQVNLCTSTLQRQQTGGGWAIVAEGRTCDPGTFLLATGQTRTETITLPDPLTPGRYRYATTVEAVNDTALAFAEFDVN